MSSALAIAGVTAVLRDLLNDGLINHNVSGTLGNVAVTARPPDRVLSGTNGNEAPQLNIFLHQVSPNPGWRNVDLPSRNFRGSRLSNPPLALDLHYLISAYGAEDLHAEILLGYAMQLMHETPVLTRDAINEALIPSPAVAGGLPPALQALADSGLADQVEQIKITPEYLGTEEMSKIWSAVQSHYRPTVSYLLTVVLVESKQPVTSALPVLTRGSNDEGVLVTPHLEPPLPTISEIIFPENQTSARLGDTTRINGVHLNGSNVHAVFNSLRLPDPLTVNVAPGSADTQVSLGIPHVPANWAAGLYTVQISVARPGETEARTTNPLPFYVAPTMSLPATVTHPDVETTRVALDTVPVVRQNQYVLLSIGNQQAPAEPRAGDTDSLEFNFNRIAAGQYYSKLTIDGVDSWMILRSGGVPEFDSTQRITVP
jgi:hypothetical protein